MLNSVRVAQPPNLAGIYARYHRLVEGLVRTRLPPPAVDDAIQDVFLAIHRRLGQAPADELRMWVIGVTRSVVHSHQRAAIRREARVSAIEVPSPDPPVEAVLDHRAALRRMDEALRQLSPAQREVFVLIEYRGLTAPEAAERTGSSVNTVNSRLRLARRKLADAATVRAGEGGPRSQAQVRRTWAIIAAKAGLVAPGVGMVATPAVGWIGGGIGLAVASAAVFATALAGPRGAPEPAHTTTQIVTPASAPRSVGGDPGSPSVIGERPSPSTVAETPRLQAVAAPRGAAARMPSKPKTRSQDSGAPTSAAESSLETEPLSSRDVPSTLADEAELLARAASRIDAGDRAGGRSLLAEHARRFRQGALSKERERLERHIRGLPARADGS